MVPAPRNYSAYVLTMDAPAGLLWGTFEARALNAAGPGDGSEGPPQGEEGKGVKGGKGAKGGKGRKGKGRKVMDIS